MGVMNTQDTAKLQAYMREKFSNNGFTMQPREKATDSLEVLLHGEFIGVIYKDEEDGEISFDFNMAIIKEDLIDA